MIKREMTIGEIFETFPMHAQKIANELMRIGLNCVGCGASTHETLEAGMYLHGMDEGQINALLETLNTIITQEIDGSTITLTKRAAEKFITICKSEGKGGSYLRFFDKLGGCSGFEYVLDFSMEKLSTEEAFIQHGVTILVDKGIPFEAHWLRDRLFRWTKCGWLQNFQPKCQIFLFLWKFSKLLTFLLLVLYKYLRVNVLNKYFN